MARRANVFLTTKGPWNIEFLRALLRFGDKQQSTFEHTFNEARSEPDQQDAEIIAALPELLDLLLDAFDQIRRSSYAEGETDRELANRINDKLSDVLGDDWLARLGAEDGRDSR